MAVLVRSSKFSPETSMFTGLWVGGPLLSCATLISAEGIPLMVSLTAFK